MVCRRWGEGDGFGWFFENGVDEIGMNLDGFKCVGRWFFNFG